MKEMANILNISISYYQKIEYGIRKPSRDFLIKLKTKFPKIDLNMYIQ
jgi:transcriptional regulator with XRE-family HTH domain